MLEAVLGIDHQMAINDLDLDHKIFDRIERIDLDLDQFPNTGYFRFVTQCKKQIDNSGH